MDRELLYPHACLSFFKRERRAAEREGRRDEEILYDCAIRLTHSDTHQNRHITYIHFVLHRMDSLEHRMALMSLHDLLHICYHVSKILL